MYIVFIEKCNYIYLGLVRKLRLNYVFCLILWLRIVNKKLLYEIGCRF